MTKVTNYAANDRAISEYEYEYDLSGAITKEISIVEGKKTVREFEYDAVGSLHSETVSAGKSTCKYTYEYDHSGNRTKVTSDENGKKSTVTYQYDKADRLTRTSDSVNGNTLFTYDANGNRASKTGSDGVKYTYEYDTENRLRAVKDNGTLLMAALYDGNGDRVFTVNRSTRNYTETTSQPGVNSPTGPTHGADSSDNTANAGLNGQPQGTMYLYAYDDKLPADPADTIFWYGFGQGMINSITVASAHLSVWFNEMWETITEHFELFARRLGELGILGSGEKEYSYDYNGAKPSQQLQDQMYLYQTMLIPYGFSDKTEEDYELMLYVNDVNRGYTETLATYGTDGYVNTVYTYGNERLISEQFGKSSYYTYNGRGDVSSLLSDAGVPQVNYSYDAYGNYTATAVSDNPYSYNAEAFDYSTGLQYLRARYYDNSIGGFITQDSYRGTLTNPSTLNLYDYVGNDPLNQIDPSGHFWNIVAGAVIGGIIGGAASVGGQLLSGKKLSEVDWKSVGASAVGGAVTGAIISANPALVTQASTIGGAVSGGLDAALHWNSKKSVASNLGNVALGAGIGAASGYVGGKVGEKVFGTVSNALTSKITNSFGASAINNTTREGIKVVSIGAAGAAGNVAGGMVSRFSGTLVSGALSSGTLFNRDVIANSFKSAFDLRSMATDAVLGFAGSTAGYGMHKGANYLLNKVSMMQLIEQRRQTCDAAEKASSTKGQGKVDIEALKNQSLNEGSKQTEHFKAPEINVDNKGNLTNGKYTLDQKGMQVHVDGKNISKSQFLYDVDANKAVLDAAAYADENNLWVPNTGNPSDFANKAKVYVENGPVGVTGSGELTNYINIYRTKTGYVHGSPGNP